MTAAPSSEWNAFQAHVPTLDVVIDEAALHMTIGGSTLPLKHWLEMPEVGSPEYDRSTRSYVVEAPDTKTFNTYIANLQALANEYGFVIIRTWCILQTMQTWQPCTCGCAGDWSTCGFNSHAFPFPVRRCLFYPTSG